MARFIAPIPAQRGTPARLPARAPSSPMDPGEVSRLTLVDDLRRTLDKSDPARSAETVVKIVEVFVREAPSFGPEHVAVFDEVIGILASRIEMHARAALSETLAEIPNAPSNLIRKLAQDEISVARHVLARSPQLSDETLAQVALALGHDHMVAITERRELGEIVTDVLVEHGDQVVVHAATRNPGARFSTRGFNILVSRSEGDETLQFMLSERPDLPIERLHQLIHLARAAARHKLLARLGRRSWSLVEKAVETGAKAVGCETSSALLRHAVADLPASDAKNRFESGVLGEADLKRYAAGRQRVEAAAALTLMAGLPSSFAHRLFVEREDDVLLIVCRSLGLSWTTVEMLNGLKLRKKGSAPDIARMRKSYDALTIATSERILRFLRLRDNLNSTTLSLNRD